MMSTPVVSTIIPSYNRQTLVGRAMRSALAQSHADLELIVVDDGSTDETRAMVQAFTDPRLRYFYQENAGLAAARNTGIRAASGEWVAFLDDDDVWYPEKLAKQMLAVRSRPDAGLINAGWVCVAEDGAPIREVRPWLWRPRLDLDTWLVACPAVPSAVMVRREWLERAGGFDESISRARLGGEDWDLWLRLAHQGCPMAWAEELVCAYRVHPDSMSRNAPRQRQGMLMTLDKFFARPDLPDGILSQKDRVYAQAHLRGAARLYAAGLAEKGSEDVEKALALDPDLLAHGCDRLFRAMTGWVADPSVADPVQLMSRVFDNLPCTAARVKPLKRSALGVAAKQALFNAHLRRDRWAVLRSLKQIAAFDPGLLRDVGIWSALADAVIGRAATSTVRPIVRRLRDRGRSVRPE